MKRYVTLATLLATLTIGSANAQILKKFKAKVKEKADQKVDQKIDEAAQKTVDAPEEAAKKKKKNSDSKTDETVANKTVINNVAYTTKSDIDYGSFDFVPGDSILFEDEFVNESINEIPSLWVAQGGKLEIIKVDGKTVMGFLADGTYAYPRMKKYNYLPKRFTVEFDFMSKHNSGKTTQEASSDGNGSGEAKIYFYTDGKDRNGDVLKDFDEVLTFHPEGGASFKSFNAKYKGGEPNQIHTDLCDKWIHISIAVTETNMKMYVNNQRLLNVPVEGKPASITLGATGSDYEMSFKSFIKNVRIAGGLKTPYKQGTSEIPKTFIARGIKFDYQLATLKPESIGELNNVVAILKDHPEAKYEIGGHTSKAGNGATAANQKLSEERARAVKDKLVNMGIDAARLTIKGYGETKPIADNASPEGRANNQRVEFTLVK